jgi:hypothetical protein
LGTLVTESAVVFLVGGVEEASLRKDVTEIFSAEDCDDAARRAGDPRGPASAAAKNTAHNASIVEVCIFSRCMIL